MSDPTPLGGPRIRRAPIPDDALVVVRGEESSPEVRRAQAQRFLRRFPDWGRYGLSAFYARNDTEIDDLAANQLSPFETIRLLRIVDLIDAGFEVVPTFRTPHVTIAFTDDLDDGLARLDELVGEIRPNRYHAIEPDATEGR